MEAYERKVQMLYMLQHGRCAISGHKIGWMDNFQLHHAEIHNTRWARERWPLLVDSLLNLQLVEGNGHMTKPKPRPYKLSDEALDLLQSALETDREAADILNCRAAVLDVQAIRRCRDRLLALARKAVLA